MTTDSPVRTLLMHLPYPALLGLGVLLAWLAQRVGLSMGAGLIVATVGLTLSVAALEQRFPLSRDWGFTRQDLGADLLHSLFSNGVPARILELGLKGALLGLAARMARQGLDLWPDSLPLVAQVALALFAAEVGFYTIHRFFHECGLDGVWRWHAVHHSLRRMYFLAGTRNHPVQVFFSFGATVVILWFLGAPAEVLYYKTAFHTANGILQHCNLNVGGGLWSWIFAGPELHRWHHSRLPEESNHNYGNNLIVLDVLFGTRFLPPGPSVIPLGLPEERRFTNTYWGHLKLPFEWDRGEPE